MDAVTGRHGAHAQLSSFPMVLMLDSPPSPWCSWSVLLLSHGARAQVAGEERGWGGENGAPRTGSSKSSTSSIGLYNAWLRRPLAWSTYSRRRRNSRRLYSLSSFNCRWKDVFVVSLSLSGSLPPSLSSPLHSPRVHSRARRSLRRNQQGTWPPRRRRRRLRQRRSRRPWSARRGPPASRSSCFAKRAAGPRR